VNHSGTESDWKTLSEDPIAKRETLAMTRWAIGFLIVALVAAVLAFTGIAASAGGFARTLFIVAVILFLVSLGLGRLQGPPRGRASDR